MTKFLMDLINKIADEGKQLRVLRSQEHQMAGKILIDYADKLMKEYAPLNDNSLMYNLVAQSYDRDYFLVSDESLSMTQLTNATIIQPLVELDMDQMEELQKALVQELKADVVHPVIIIPYDVKILKVRGIVPLDQPEVI